MGCESERDNLELHLTIRWRHGYRPANQRYWHVHTLALHVHKRAISHLHLIALTVLTLSTFAISRSNTINVYIFFSLYLFHWWINSVADELQIHFKNIVKITDRKSFIALKILNQKESYFFKFEQIKNCLQKLEDWDEDIFMRFFIQSK